MNNEKTFEEKMNRLNEIVLKMNDSNVSLDENLKLYVEGKELIKELTSTIEIAKKKVENISRNDD